MSISAHSLSSPLHLCEVEVLSPVADHVDLTQCGEEVGLYEGATVYQNTCMILQANQKMNFSDGLSFCQKRGMVLLHNQTENDSLAYEFVK